MIGILGLGALALATASGGSKSLERRREPFYLIPMAATVDVIEDDFSETYEAYVFWIATPSTVQAMLQRIKWLERISEKIPVLAGLDEGDMDHQPLKIVVSGEDSAYDKVEEIVQGFHRAIRANNDSEAGAIHRKNTTRLMMAIQGVEVTDLTRLCFHYNKDDGELHGGIDFSFHHQKILGRWNTLAYGIDSLQWLQQLLAAEPARETS